MYNYYPYFGSNQMNQQPYPMTPLRSAPNYLNGRIVNGVNDIQVNEVPGDGSVGFFPKQDLSEIYVKAWNNDGTISTVIFVPQQVSKPQAPTVSNENLQEQLNRIEELLTAKNKPQQKGGNQNVQSNQSR